MTSFPFLPGKIFEQIGRDMSRTTFSFPPAKQGVEDVHVKDFAEADWLTEGPSAGRTTNEGALEVNDAGDYFVYADFYFFSRGSSCSYDLVYGDRKQTCLLDLEGGAEMFKHRKCSLGFAARVEAKTQFKLVYRNHGDCVTDLNSLREVLPRAKMGVIKIA